MILHSQTSLRLAFFGCAALLGIQAAWMILPEFFVRTNLSHQNRATAETVARLAVIRGDLWTHYALSYGELAWPLDRGIGQPAVRQQLEEAQAATKRALRGSPHEARLWLLLAALTIKIESLDHQQSNAAVGALKMAYYTAPNEVELSPFRLMIAVRPAVIADEELQQLVRDELRMLLTRNPRQKADIVAAYREASPTAKSLIEDVVNLQDPALLASVRSEAGVR